MSHCTIQQDTTVMATAAAQAIPRNPAGLLRDFYQTSLLACIALWMGGHMDGEIFLAFAQ